MIYYLIEIIGNTIDIVSKAGILDWYVFILCIIIYTVFRFISSRI